MEFNWITSEDAVKPRDGRYKNSEVNKQDDIRQQYKRRDTT